MSFDEEWAAARAAASANASAHTGPGPGPGRTADLTLNQDHIGAIGSEAFKLHERLATDGRHADTATTAAAGALAKEGFATGSALLMAGHRWESQVRTLVAACANISNGLNYSLTSHARDERHLYAEFTSSKIDQFLK